MNKKAYLRTLEAFTAVILTFVFIIYIIPTMQGNEVHRDNINILDTLIYQESFRNCVLSDSVGAAEVCAEGFVSDKIPSVYSFKVEISENNEFEAQGLPQRRVFTETSMIAGNLTVYSPRYIQVYYWLK